MRRNILTLGLSLAFLTSGALAQQNGPRNTAAVPTTTQQDVYCSGMFTTDHVPHDVQVVSGEEANYKVTFAEGDYVYINRGSDKGVKAGDVFLVMRPVNNETHLDFFTWQNRLLRAMGQAWEDEGRLKVVVAQKNVSIAQVSDACGYLQRGDAVLPFEERPVPQLKQEANFDRFAPPSGKKKAMIVVGKGFTMQAGTDSIVYVNLGANQGVKVGDYFRIYRHEDNGSSTVYQMPNMGTAVEGYGSAPGHYSWKDLPREILGEGVVLRTSPNSATVLITYSLRQIYDGDYCELE
ncbi:MAG TPA: hypothetical protein VJN90_08095 [Candidatus Acidoferrales bacterium]|nr:hypothetical protein [Candidatus Acidoferrales bacterium]